MVARDIGALGRARSALCRAARSTKAVPGWLLVLGLLLGAHALAAARAEAESAWVRGELRLNLRDAPGTQYRVLGVLETGDGVQVLRRTEKWTQVRLPIGQQGWIPKGYLRSEPPPEVRPEETVAELASLRTRLENSDGAFLELKTLNDELSARDSGQRSRIEQLSAEISELRRARRWPEWLTGASVLTAGMLLGAILQRNATRRPAARIRL